MPQIKSFQIDVAELGANTSLQASIVHDNLSGSGSNTHAQLDTHVAGTALKHDSSVIVYDNTISGLSSTNVKLAIDELSAGAGDYVLKAGDTMTGDLIISPTGPANLYVSPIGGSGASTVILEPAGSSDAVGLRLSDSAKNGRVDFHYAQALGTSIWLLSDAAGIPQAGVYLESNGNVRLAVGAAAPTLADQLTRKDYVDSLLDLSIDVTTGVGSPLGMTDTTLPATWTTTYNSVGNFTITHNLGISNPGLALAVMYNGTARVLNPTTITTNAITFQITDTLDTAVEGQVVGKILLK